MESSDPKEPRIRVEAPSGSTPEVPKKKPEDVSRLLVVLLFLGLLSASGSLLLAVLPLFK